MSVSEVRPRSPLPPSAPVSPATAAAAAAPSVGAVGLDAFAPVARAGNVVSVARAGAAVPSNNFRYTLTGPNPPHVGGGFFAELRQANELRKLVSLAADSVASGGAGSQTLVEAKLRSLELTPLDRGEDVTRATYESEVAGASADALFEHFVKNPEQVFGAAGLALRPMPSELKTGARVMIEDPGPPAAWMPVQVHVDPRTRTVRFDTLDGHPLRGFNAFTFQDNGRGGAQVKQVSDYQFSSLISKLGSGVIGGGQKQHDTWKAVHAHLFSATQQEAVQW